MQSVRNLMTTVLLAGLTAAGPVAFAAWVARPGVGIESLPPAHGPALLAQNTTQSPQGPIPSASDASVNGPNGNRRTQRAAGAGGQPVPRLLGTLYASGRVTVSDADNRELRLNSDAYSYRGGELVRVSDGALGVLRLGARGLVFFCGGSRASVRGAAGTPAVSLPGGGSRVLATNGDGIRVDAGGFGLTVQPGADGAPAAAEVFRDGDAVIVLPLAGQVAIDGVDAPAGAEDKQILELTADGGAVVVTRTPLPADLAPPRAPRADLAGQLTGGTYLCRTRDLALIARNGSIPAPPVDSLLPPTLQPPGAPELALAKPEADGQFDPNSLPPPAAGPDPVVLVPVPAAATPTTAGGSLGTLGLVGSPE